VKASISFEHQSSLHLTITTNLSHNDLNLLKCLHEYSLVLLILHTDQCFNTVFVGFDVTMVGERRGPWNCYKYSASQNKKSI
jgi:hypothetical protein